MLGTLQHPGIAAVYAAGTFDSGFGELPYFAMELVEGPPDRRPLSSSMHRAPLRSAGS